TITIPSGVTLSGGLTIGNVLAAAGVTWVFQGIVSASFGQTLTLSAAGDVFINQGAWQSIDGGTLVLAANWLNNGTITGAGTNSAVNLGGTFTADSIGTLNHVSGIVNIAGSLNNTGRTLALNDTTGTWILSNGTINGGIITTADGAVLNVGPNNNVLNGVT